MLDSKETPKLKRDAVPLTPGALLSSAEAKQIHMLVLWAQKSLYGMKGAQLDNKDLGIHPQASECLIRKKRSTFDFPRKLSHIFFPSLSAILSLVEVAH